MLSLLHIENIALIESADISFDSGFNVLTGETGAGKSIIIDAIGTAMGARASRDLIRTGAKSARVSAIFCKLPQLPWFQENGIFPDENGELILERELQADGKNICRVAGRLVTVSQLKALGQQLLNIHGQHDGQLLMDERHHLNYLDRFGKTQKELDAYGKAYEKVSELRRAFSGFQMNESEKARRIDTLTYQIGELERAQLDPGEEELLLARREVLRNGEKFMDALERAWIALIGGDDGDGAVGLAGEAEFALSTVALLNDRMSGLAEKAAEVHSAADDLAQEVRDLRESFDFSPGDLDEVEGRLDILYRLKKKYGATVEEMLAYLEHCRKELNNIESSDEKFQRLEQELSAALKEARARGEVLSQARRIAAAELAEQIQRELTQLDMPRVHFQVAFSEQEGNDGMDATGIDEVRFLMSANVGEELKPIQKIASGGELARIMLAMKNVLVENDDVVTLVFDEVDTGVSGRAAQKVAEKLYCVARSKQVLCVTHLPQIAAMGDVHFSVEKGEVEGRTFTAVLKLDELQRREELARLTGGSSLTSTMLEGAAELLRSAEKFKKGTLI